MNSRNGCIRRVCATVGIAGAWVAATLVGVAGTPAFAPEPTVVPYDPPVGELDVRLPEYKAPAATPPGRLLFAGTRSMSSGPDGWVAGFREKCKGADVEYDSIGSRNAIPMFVSGAIPICCTSRPMSPSDFEEFQKNHGYRPIQMITGIDVWAIYVHRDNPVRAISLIELDAIWSSTRARGGEEITRWAKLGGKGDWDKPITLYAGDRDVFNNVMIDALARGQVRNDVNVIEEFDGAGGVRKLAADKFGIAFGKVTAARGEEYARALGIESGTGRPAPPTFAGIRAGRYSLIRTPLSVYVNKKPGKPADPLLVEFFRYVYSREGQEIVQNSGDRERSLPVSLELGEAMLEMLTR